MFHDEELFKSYINYLKKYSTINFIHEQLSDLYSEIVYYDSLINLEFPGQSFDTSYLYKSAEDIRYYLPELETFLNSYSQQKQPNIYVDTIEYVENIVYDNTPEYFVNAYLNSRFDDSLEIQVFNYYPRKVKLLGTGHNNEFIDFYLPKVINIDPFKNSAQIHSFISDTIANYLFFMADGSDDIFVKEICKWPFPQGETPQQKLLKKVNLVDNNAIEKIEGENIYLKNTEFELSKPLIIPAGYIVNVKAGTKINIVDSAFILSYSAFKFIGEKDNNIIFTSSDFTARGITVLQAEHKSILKYVKFNNLNTFYYEGWGLTGALTFYESDVDLYNITFYRNQCEDALNIIRSDFSVINSSFDNIYADAFDSDFSTGMVEDVIFTNIGNDAIDFSGSRILIQNTDIIGAEDKGISGGEDSKLEVRNCKIEKSNIGIASKDLSVVKVYDTKVTDCNYGLVLLKKKVEYGPAEIIANNLTISNSKVKHLIEQGSKVTENGLVIKGKEKDVAKLFY